MQLIAAHPAGPAPETNVYPRRQTESLVLDCICDRRRQAAVCQTSVALVGDTLAFTEEG